jgi:two-component system response regulator MprA
LSPGRTKILVADDDAEVRFLLETTLAADGYDILTASNGADAIRIATQEHPSLVVLDVTMPQADGYEVTRALRHHDDTRDIRIIMLTAHREEDIAARSFEQGADDYLTKPLSPALLRARVKTWLLRSTAGSTEA